MGLRYQFRLDAKDMIMSGTFTVSSQNDDKKVILFERIE